MIKNILFFQKKYFCSNSSPGHVKFSFEKPAQIFTQNLKVPIKLLCFHEKCFSFLKIVKKCITFTLTETELVRIGNMQSGTC